MTPVAGFSIILNFPRNDFTAVQTILIFHISFKLVIKIFSCTCHNYNNDFFTYIFNPICKLIICFVIKNIIAANSAQISCFGFSYGFDKLKDHLKNKNDERQLKKRLGDYFSQYKSQFEQICQDSEFDLQGVLDCFNNNLNNEIDQFIFGRSNDERSNAKKAIIFKARYYSKANNKEAKSQVDNIVNNILSIIYDFYAASVDNNLLLAVNILSDELSPKLDNINAKIDNLGLVAMQSSFNTIINQFCLICKV